METPKFNHVSPEMEHLHDTLAFEAMNIDDMRREIAYIEDYLKTMTLDESSDHEVMIELNNVLVLFKEKARLNQKLQSLSKIKGSVHEFLDEKQLEIAYVPKSHEAIDSYDAISRRIDELDQEIGTWAKNFDDKHPADYLIFRTNLNSLSHENRTN
ncbi:MAG: hypothetical protein JWM20_34 [Patescibacteria group bacterium]|nr:hypothetical protein [Patescibacteria group bacterium]